jgi:hypothetical protein
MHRKYALDVQPGGVSDLRQALCRLRVVAEADDGGETIANPETGLDSVADAAEEIAGVDSVADARVDEEAVVAAAAAPDAVDTTPDADDATPDADATPPEEVVDS